MERQVDLRSLGTMPYGVLHQVCKELHEQLMVARYHEPGTAHILEAEPPALLAGGVGIELRHGGEDAREIHLLEPRPARARFDLRDTEQRLEGLVDPPALLEDRLQLVLDTGAP